MVLDALNKSREDAIETVVAEFFEVRRRLCEDQAHSFECSSIHLGALLKAMSKMGVMDHTSISPWPGHSLLSLEQAICDIKEPTWKSNCPESSASPKESTEESTKTTTKSSNDSDGAPSTNTKSAPAPAATAPRFGFPATSSGGLFGGGTPAPTGGLFSFGNATTAPSGGFGTNASSGGLFGKPASSDAEDKTKPPPPRCSLAARTSPIIEELFKTVNGLQLGDYVKKE